MTQLINLSISTALILFYYSFGKKIMISFSRIIIKSRFIKSKISLEELKGVIELFFIVVSHLIFCFFLAKFLTISLWNVFQVYNFHFVSLFLGILLGIGQMALSSTLCLLLITILRKIVPERVPSTIVEWVVQSRAGWVKHHFDALKHLPIYLSPLLILFQITAEETVFRGILLNYLLPYSRAFAVCFSTLLFTLIQTFLMPRKISGMFPIIGAIIMGFSNAYIFIQIPNIYPLIIGHTVFFLFSLLF